MDAVPSARFLLSLCLRIKRINVFEVVQNGGEGTWLHRATERNTRRKNVFSRAPSIKGIFMQRAKVIRSLGMHIARASHGLLLLLARLERERKPVLKGPAFREVASSFRLSFFKPPPPPSNPSQSTRKRNIIVYVGPRTPSCRKSWRSCKPLRRKLCAFR